MFSRSSLVLLAMISGYVGAFVVPLQHLQQHNNERSEAGDRANTRMMAPAPAPAYFPSPSIVPQSWKLCHEDKNIKTVGGGGFLGTIGKLGQELMAPFTGSRKEGGVTRAFFSNAKENVSDVANKASNSASDAADTVSNKASDAANTIGDKANDDYRSASDATKDAAENADEKTKGLYGSAKENVGDAAAATKRGVGNAASAVKGAASDATSAVKDAVSGDP